MLGWLRSRIGLSGSRGQGPSTAENLFQLGNQHISSGHVRKAERAYRAALQARPDHADAMNNLGALLRDAGRAAEAEELFSSAVLVRPHFAEAHFNLATLLIDLRRYDEAADHLRRSLRADANQPDAHYWLGNAAMALGDARAACSAYEAALVLDPGHVRARWGIAMAQVPAVFDSDVAAGAAPAAFTRAISELRAWLGEHQAVGVHAAVGAQQPFYLAYVEGNHRGALSEYGRLCAELMAQWAAAVGVPAPAASGGASCRVGVVSSQIQNHSVWNAVVRGWVEHLDPKRFVLHLFHTGSVEDDQTAWARRRVGAGFHSGRRDWPAWAKAISDSRLDVLLYPEIGMDATALRLASLRLARVQLASWGHPVTTGLPTIDGYLSAAALEPPDGATHYSEALLALPRLGCCYRPFGVRAAAVDLAELGVEPGDRVLACAGTPSKYAPRYDALWIEVAQRCRPCKLIFFRAEPPAIWRAFEARLAAAFARAGVDFNAHVRFVPWMSQERFFGLLKRSHALLDSPGFSGFNTAMQAIECGCPIVAWEGAAMRSRFASAILRQMGIDDCVCSEPAAFAACASRLCSDGEYAGEVRNRIATRRSALFGDRGTVAALEDVLLRLCSR